MPLSSQLAGSRHRATSFVATACSLQTGLTPFGMPCTPLLKENSYSYGFLSFLKRGAEDGAIFEEGSVVSFSSCLRLFEYRCFERVTNHIATDQEVPAERVLLIRMVFASGPRSGALTEGSPEDVAPARTRATLSQSGHG